MAIDFAAKVARILRTGGPLPLTSATYVPGGASDASPPTQQALVGVLHGRGVDPSFDSGLDDELATLTVELAKFTIGDPRSPDDQVIVGAEVPWQVRSVDRRQAHVTFALGRRLVRGRKLEVPAALGGMAAWWSGNAGVSASSPAGSWLDRISGNDATQTDLLKQPTFVANVINGKPVIRFDRARLDRLDTLVLPVSAQPFSVFAVIRFRTVVNGSGIWALQRQADLNNDRFIGQLSGSSPQFLITDSVGGGTGPTSTGVVVQDQAHFAAWEERNASDHRVRLDAADEVAAAVGPFVPNVDIFFVGAGTFGGSDLDLAELMIYNRAPLSTAELRQLKDWVTSTYAITLP